MKKAKWSDVPVDYRRNRKQEFIDFMLMCASGIGIGVTIALMFALFW